MNIKKTYYESEHYHGYIFSTIYEGREVRCKKSFPKTFNKYTIICIALTTNFLEAIKEEFKRFLLDDKNPGDSTMRLVREVNI